MKRARVLLVDDHALVRAGIRALIDRLDEFEVCAEAHDTRSALAQVEQQQPDIVVTDLGLGSESGLDLVRLVHTRQPALPLVVLSMHGSESHVSNAVRAGAGAYVVKDAAPSELASALASVMRGECYLSPVLAGRMLRWSAADGAGQVTARQRQILGRIGAGKSTKQIAYELGLSEKTVAGHRALIMERLGIRDRVGLALFAREQGLADVA